MNLPVMVPIAPTMTFEIDFHVTKTTTIFFPFFSLRSHDGLLREIWASGWSWDQRAGQEDPGAEQNQAAPAAVAAAAATPPHAAAAANVNASGKVKKLLHVLTYIAADLTLFCRAQRFKKYFFRTYIALRRLPNILLIKLSIALENVFWNMKKKLLFVDLKIFLLFLFLELGSPSSKTIWRPKIPLRLPHNNNSSGESACHTRRRNNNNNNSSSNNNNNNSNSNSRISG